MGSRSLVDGGCSSVAFIHQDPDEGLTQEDLDDFYVVISRPGVSPTRSATASPEGDGWVIPTVYVGGRCLTGSGFIQDDTVSITITNTGTILLTGVTVTGDGIVWTIGTLPSGQAVVGKFETKATMLVLTATASESEPTVFTVVDPVATRSYPIGDVGSGWVEVEIRVGSERVRRLLRVGDVLAVEIEVMAINAPTVNPECELLEKPILYKVQKSMTLSELLECYQLESPLLKVLLNGLRGPELLPGRELIVVPQGRFPPNP